MAGVVVSLLSTVRYPLARLTSIETTLHCNMKSAALGVALLSVGHLGQSFIPTFIAPPSTAPRFFTGNTVKNLHQRSRRIRVASSSVDQEIEANGINGDHDDGNNDNELEIVAENILLPPREQKLPGTVEEDESLHIEADVMMEPQQHHQQLAGEDDEGGGEYDLTTLPRHSHAGVNDILVKTERVLRALHKHSKKVEQEGLFVAAKEAGRSHEAIYANSYVDLGKIDVVGLDFDYTLVTYTEDLLELIYSMALKRLVSDRQYPLEMTQIGLKYDPFFSIRGLAVDRETGWITHLSYTHKVAVAWEGREKLPTSRIFEEYRGKRALRPSERRKRLKPLNDIFSMAECCLIADTIQFFKDRNIPYCAENVVTDVLNTVTSTHLSGDFHRLVAKDPSRYFDPTPQLGEVLSKLKASGKRLIFVSNSPFWYVDAGMRYVFGPDWRNEWDAIITSAGKPNFYTDDRRPFREVCQDTRRIMFKKVERFERGRVYTEGCLRELKRLMDWRPIESPSNHTFESPSSPLTSNVLYIGDSLFADLVDAKREFGWTTAAVTPEVGFEKEIQNQAEFERARRSIELLLNALRLLQTELGATMRTKEDLEVLDAMERLVSLW